MTPSGVSAPGLLPSAPTSVPTSSFELIRLRLDAGASGIMYGLAPDSEKEKNKHRHIRSSGLGATKSWTGVEGCLKSQVSFPCVLEIMAQSHQYRSTKPTLSWELYQGEGGDSFFEQGRKFGGRRAFRPRCSQGCSALRA